jgi:formate hydrogenlyase transcriptional activator
VTSAANGHDPGDVLERILAGTATESGEQFFATLVKSLAETLDVHGAWVTEYLRDARRLRAHAFWLAGKWVSDFEYDLQDTPCAPVVEDPRMVHIPDRAIELYPKDPDLCSMGAASYLGVPLFDLDGQVLGHLAILDTKPMPADPRLLAIFQIFGGRAAAELRRLRTECDVRRRDARIESLAAEAEWLRQELGAREQAGGILGRSEPLLRVLREVDQVSGTDATVLILGETGTGKELVARAIHAASRRRAGNLVPVNCAAIPATLIESELFGHERGAFTGATQRREGRFAMAEKGTIFLDEIGELARDMQAKLLRVLQEGEFEPLGSSRSRKADVRVIAATNRDLEREVREGRFREDLYYRLHVFPITIPPLRQRGDDVLLLASAFVERYAQRMGRSVSPLSPESIQRLKSYAWPGNVRELQNVIERAVITARDGEIDLAQSLPDAGPVDRGRASAASGAGGGAEAEVLTAAEMETLERQNLRKALERTAWQVAGEDGAAQLLGMKPSTLASRMKALGLHRPEK